MIFNIQRCSIHDGEGLRTLIFFKGCPLRCPWCSNPESQARMQEVMEAPARCIGCGCCKEVCQYDAIGDDLLINRNKCQGCFACTDVCNTEAKKLVGKMYSLDALYDEIDKDRPYYIRSNGGVTFSGGEPLDQGESLVEIVKRCYEKNIDVAIETCGDVEYQKFHNVLPYVSSMFFDIKILDENRHKAITGRGNSRILSNLNRISENGIPLTIRTPVVPGYTDDEENILKITEYIKSIPNVQNYELLKYHRFGEQKYEALGRRYSLKDVNPPTDDKMNLLAGKANISLKGSGIRCFWVNENRKEEGKCYQKESSD